MKSFLLTLYKLMFVFIPLPIFFDFGTFSFVYIDIYEYNYLTDNPIIPMPIGGITFFFAIIIGYVSSLIYPSTFRSVLTPSRTIVFYFLVVLPISLYAIFISGISIPRLIQLILPMTFISLLSMPISLDERLGMVKYCLLGAFVFFNLHIISIFLEAEYFLSIDDAKEYSSFFGILIYQSLVTYPAVLSLYFFLMMALIFVANNIMPSLRKYKYFYYYFIFVLLYLLAASGRRAFLVEYVGSLLIIFGFSIIFSIYFRFVKKSSLWFFLLFLILFCSFLFFYINTPLSERVLMSVEENTFDSGRIDILSRAFGFFTNNTSVLFLGGGEKDVPGFHNFILDQIYRVGLIGFTLVYITMALLIKRFIKTNDLGTRYKYHRRLFVLILLTSLFLQSMINASVSQPYYFVNFLVVIIFIYFILFSSSNDEIKS